MVKSIFAFIKYIVLKFVMCKENETFYNNGNEIDNASIQEKSHGMKQNFVGVSYMY